MSDDPIIQSTDSEDFLKKSRRYRLPWRIRLGRLGIIIVCAAISAGSINFILPLTTPPLVSLILGLTLTFTAASFLFRRFGWNNERQFIRQTKE